MTTAILCAITQEVDAILKHFKDVKVKTKANRDFHFAKLENGEDVIITRSGVGKIEASITTSLLVNVYGVTKVLFSGVAGSLSGKDIPIGALTIATHTCQGDFDITPFGLPKGINDGEEVYLETSKDLYNKSREIAKKNNVDLLDAVICTQDSFIQSHAQRDEIRKHFPKANIVEMEGFAVAKTCMHLDIPYVIFRSISDDDDESSSVVFEKFASEVSEQHAHLILAIANSI